MPTEVQNSYNTDATFVSVSWQRGQRLTISNRQVSSVSFYLKRIGAPPTGGGYITIYTLADVVMASVTVSNAEIQALPTSYALFTKSITPTVINEEVRMVFGVNTFGTPELCVAMAYQNTDVKASESRTSSNPWTEDGTSDCAYQYTYIDYTPTIFYF